MWDRVLLGGLGLVGVGVVGAWMTHRVVDGEMPWWVTGLVAMMSGCIWGWVSPAFRGQLTLGSVGFDVVYGGSYVLGFLLMGERLSGLGWLGVGVSFLGIVLMGMGQK